MFWGIKNNFIRNFRKQFKYIVQIYMECLIPSSTLFPWTESALSCRSFTLIFVTGIGTSRVLYIYLSPRHYSRMKSSSIKGLLQAFHLLRRKHGKLAASPHCIKASLFLFILCDIWNHLLHRNILLTVKKQVLMLILFSFLPFHSVGSFTALLNKLTTLIEFVTVYHPSTFSVCFFCVNPVERGSNGKSTLHFFKHDGTTLTRTSKKKQQQLWASLFNRSVQ